MKPSGCLLLNLAIGGLMFSSPSAAQAQGPVASGQIERVVITAERRSSTLDATPASVTALDGARLAEQGATGLAEVLQAVPNTTVTYGLTAPQIFMRGIGNVFQLAGGDPGVALYADGVYLSDQTSINYAMFDTQRVEVLRGPQGALYGRNATGGAVNLISARPTNDFQARLGIEAGNHGRKQAEGFISGPFQGSATTGRLAFQLRLAVTASPS